MTGPIRVLYAGSYKPTYPRNKIIIDGLRKNGASVTECNERGSGLLKYCKLAYRLLRLRGTYDVMVVGFPGQEVMFIARLCASAPVVFDVFTSHYMGYVLDRGYFKPGSIRSGIYRFLDRWSCRMADSIILDTNAHIDFFVSEFGLPREKFRRVLLGANTDMHHPRPAEKSGDQFTVLFWGGFIPLQGTEHIIAAADVLRSEQIRFILIGAGQMLNRDKEQVRRLGLTNVEFPGKVGDDELVRYIRDADVCLGAFGGGIKADSTIQNKIYEALASRKALVTARTTAIGEVFIDGEHCLMCERADSEDLAAKIRRLRDNPDMRNALAENGYRFFCGRLTERHIGADMVYVLREALL